MHTKYTPKKTPPHPSRRLPNPHPRLLNCSASLSSSCPGGPCAASPLSKPRTSMTACSILGSPSGICSFNAFTRTTACWPPYSMLGPAAPIISSPNGPAACAPIRQPPIVKPAAAYLGSSWPKPSVCKERIWPTSIQRPSGTAASWPCWMAAPCVCGLRDVCPRSFPPAAINLPIPIGA